MNFIIISGQSGAGKSQAKKVFEDFGYYCIDNLPPSLIPNFVELLEQNSEGIYNIALVIDIRGGKFFKDLEKNLQKLSLRKYDYKIFYFEASDEVLLKRFKETRRTHPLDPMGQIEMAIKEEKTLLDTLKKSADFVINTDNLTQSNLKQEISKALKISESSDSISITLMSFGFKSGVPKDVDYVFDVRFLPNPFYDESLRYSNGNDKDVRAYVMDFEESQTFKKILIGLFDFIFPRFIKEGRAQLVIGIGCTGGQHRSVTFVNELTEYYREKGYTIKRIHREIS